MAISPGLSPAHNKMLLVPSAQEGYWHLLLVLDSHTTSEAAARLLADLRGTPPQHHWGQRHCASVLGNCAAPLEQQCNAAVASRRLLHRVSYAAPWLESRVLLPLLRS